MRNFFLVNVCIAFIFTGSLTVCSVEPPWYNRGRFEPKTRIKASLHNKLDRERKDCPVTIERRNFPIGNAYPEWITVVDHSPPAQEGNENGRIIPSQLDDIDKDGIWDELFFLADFETSETKTLYFYIGQNTNGTEHKTHAEIGSYGRHVVPWWESEHIGWKLWFPYDADMYGKRKPKLVSNIHDITQVGHAAPYDLGIDIMLVGRTFGAGGVCLFEKRSLPDSLSRPRFSPFSGSGQYSDTRYAFDVVVNGSLRSMIRCHIMNWRTGKGSYELEQYLTAYKNKNYYTCSVRYLAFLPECDGVELGCGIRKMPRENEFYQRNGLVISSTDDLMNVITPLEGDPGLIEGREEFLGLALVVKDIYNPGFFPVDSFEGNYTFSIPLTDNLTYEYLVAGAWSEGSVLYTYSDFKEYVLKVSEEYNSPVDIGELKVENK